MKMTSVFLSGFLLAAALPGWARPAQEKSQRFQLEIFGYGATLRESILNKAVEAQSDRQEFFYDAYLAHLFQNSVLTSWKDQVDGAWTGFESYVPVGARIKVNISDHLLVSLGAERVGAKAATNLAATYTRTYADASTDKLSFEYKPYELSVRAWAPTLGIHVYQPAKEGWSAEGGVLIGPLFAKLLSESSWFEQGVSASFSESAPLLDPTRTSRGTTRMEGTGLGICLEIEARLSFFLTRNLGIFGGVDIGFRSIPKLSGPGSEDRDGTAVSWEGEWGMRRTATQRTWGGLTVEYPSNDWTTDPSAVRTGPFRLDLSGIWLGGGLLFRF